MTERWQCCGRGTRLLVCMECGRDKPGQERRRWTRHDVLAEWGHKRRLPETSAAGATRPQPRKPAPGHCENCYQPLRDETSLARGYGPHCWRELQKALAEAQPD